MSEQLLNQDVSLQREKTTKFMTRIPDTKDRSFIAAKLVKGTIVFRYCTIASAEGQPQEM